MLKQLTKISAVGFGNVFNAILGLTFLTAIARTLPIEEFGKYALLTSLLVSIAKLIDFGSNSLYVAKSIKENVALKDSFISLKVFLFGTATIISAFALYGLNLFSLKTFIIFFVGLLAYGINFTLFAFFQKLEKFHFAVGLNTVPAVIKGLCAGLIFFNIFSPSLSMAFFIFASSMILSASLYIFLPNEFKNFKFTTQNTFDIFKQSVPAGVSLTINNGWSAIANSVAKIAQTFSAVGIFSLADKIANIFALISISIFTVLLPKNAKRKKENLAYDLTETTVIGFGILALAVFAIVGANFLLIPIFGQKFAQSTGLLNVLIIASAITAISTFIDNYFFIEDRTNLMMTVTLTKLATFLIVSAVLLPTLTLFGLALAQLIAAVTALVLTIFIILRFK